MKVNVLHTFFFRIHAKYGTSKFLKLIHLQYAMHMCTFLLGLDYQSCPTAEDCENNAVDAYWKSASMQVILGWVSECRACAESVN